MPLPVPDISQNLFDLSGYITGQTLHVDGGLIMND